MVLMPYPGCLIFTKRSLNRDYGFSHPEYNISIAIPYENSGTDEPSIFESEEYTIIRAPNVDAE